MDTVPWCDVTDGIAKYDTRQSAGRISVIRPSSTIVVEWHGDRNDVNRPQLTLQTADHDPPWAPTKWLGVTNFIGSIVGG
jgi:hypothetical protein